MALFSDVAPTNRHTDKRASLTRCAATHDFADLALGSSAELEAVVTHSVIDAFAELSGDASPLHVDAAFARRRGYEDRVAHGAYLLVLVSRLVGMSLPGQNALLLSVSMSFTAPVLAGTHIKMIGRVEQLSDTIQSAVLGIRVLDVATMRDLARGKATVGFTKDQPHG